MMLEEAQGLLKKEKITTQDQLWGVNALYLLLDLPKETFCKIIDAVGLDTLLNKRSRYDRLLRAEDELFLRERYVRACEKLKALDIERETLKEEITCLQPMLNL